MKLKIYWLLLAVLAGFPVARAASFPEQPLFPETACDVGTALTLSEQEIRASIPQNPVGVMPWPGITGVWLNLNRSFYVVISQRISSLPGHQWVALQVRNLCDQRLLVQALKNVHDSEWEQNKVVFDLQDQPSCSRVQTQGVSLVLSLVSLDNPETEDLLQFEFRDESRNAKNKVRDRFWTGRF